MTTTISNSNLTAKIKHAGAELFSLKNSANREFIWEGNPEFWGKHSPILFPIVGTLKNDSYFHNGNEFLLTRHGFAREQVFEVLENSDNSVTFSLNSSDKTLKIYPFEFELQIIYTLIENRLDVAYKVMNKGNSKLPFSIGAHPAFTLNGDFENYSLEFEKNENLEYFLLENNLISNKKQKLKLNNKKIDLDYHFFANDALVFKSLESNSITIAENSTPFLKVNFEDFPSLGIWTKNNAPFLCIEPWFGYSDTADNFGNLFEKEGIQVLGENEVFNSVFSIEIL